MSRITTALVAVAAVSAGACDGEDDAASGPDGSLEPAADAGPADSAVLTGPRIDIVVEGDPSEKTIEDGLAGQTPRNYFLSLTRFEILRSLDDPDPAVVFDHGDVPVEVDMSGSQVVGSARIADLPTGTYSHGRVLLTSTRFDVDTTVHAGAGVFIPGEVSVVAALSDTTIDGVSRAQGWAQYTFSVPGFGEVSQIGTLPGLPSTAGGGVVQEGGKTWMVFPLEPVTLVAEEDENHVATIIYDTFESFRWADEDGVDYADEVFDSEVAGSTEPVMNFGATGYHFVYE